MLVAGEDGVDRVTLEKREHLRTQIDVSAVGASIVVQRMMEKTYLPFARGVLQVLVNPLELFGLHIIPVERNEGYGAVAKCIVASATHIQRLREPLVVGIVMVAQRRGELHAAVEQ